MINNKKVLALIQARCTSTRLPKKHFRYIGDRMLIDWVVDRLENIEEIDEIVISTTSNVSDFPLKEYAKSKGIGFYGYEGDINDVVGRHYNAVKNSDADYIIVISADCPLVDKKLILKQLYILEQGYHYVRPNVRCVHEGIDSYSINCIKFLNENSKTNYERENFGIIIRENLNLVKVGFIDLENKYTENIFRISVDNMADLKFMNEVFNELKINNLTFDIDNVLDLVKQNKELLELNFHVQQKKGGEKTYKFLIKTEASKEKGLGHIKRMMALGQYLNENKNNGVLYAINEDEIAQEILKEKGYIYDYSYTEKEDSIISLINDYNIDILIVDTQKLEGNTNYNFKNIKKKSCVKKIVLIDKIVEDEFVDLVISQGIQSDGFEEKFKGNDKVLHGLKTVFINNDFRKVIRRAKDEIVISFGGTDINNLTTKLIKVLNSIEIKAEYVYKIIIGPYFKYMDKLQEELDKFRYNYKIVENPNNIAEEIKDSKLGIIYYGVSFYEFKFLGIPTIDIASDVVYEGELRKLTRLGIGNYCGNKDNLDLSKIEQSINNIREQKLNTDICDFEYIYNKIIEGL